MRRSPGTPNSRVAAEARELRGQCLSRLEVAGLWTRATLAGFLTLTSRPAGRPGAHARVRSARRRPRPTGTLFGIFRNAGDRKSSRCQTRWMGERSLPGHLVASGSVTAPGRASHFRTRPSGSGRALRRWSIRPTCAHRAISSKRHPWGSKPRRGTGMVCPTLLGGASTGCIHTIVPSGE